MINLDENTKQIEEFIQSSIDKFRIENGNPNAIGIYSCPWAGWLTTNFNLDKTLEETYSNCPDFQFVAYDSLESRELEEECEKDYPEFKINGQIIQHDQDSGDEKLNELIFNYLKSIARELKNKNNSIFLVQMLDSGLVQQV